MPKSSHSIADSMLILTWKYVAAEGLSMVGSTTFLHDDLQIDRKMKGFVG